jgi:hypothetical protein
MKPGSFCEICLWKDFAEKCTFAETGKMAKQICLAKVVANKGVPILQISIFPKLLRGTTFPYNRSIFLCNMFYKKSLTA